jgi:hypothetical protein
MQTDPIQTALKYDLASMPLVAHSRIAERPAMVAAAALTAKPFDRKNGVDA